VPDSIPAVATIDERYLSYDVEFAEVIGGNFWKPYTLESIAAMRANARAAAASVTGGPGVQPGHVTTTSGKLMVVREYRMGKRPNWVVIVQLP
jgi:hypothetical protein